MKPTARQVAIDILRELGHEDEARWLEHPDAVRELLRHDPIQRVDYEDIGCAGDGCDGGDPEHDYTQPHSRDCSVMAAWRALGDSRVDSNIARAHGRALDDSAHEMRLVAQTKCAHPQIVRRGLNAECHVCGKWWPTAELDVALADRKPMDWGDSPGVRMANVRRAMQAGIITPEEARAILS